MLGSMLLALVFGNISILISNFSANETRYHKKMEYLYDSMNHLGLPQDLKSRVVAYYDQIWKDYRSLDGNIQYFFPELNSRLASEVFVFLRTHLILSFPFFR